MCAYTWTCLTEQEEVHLYWNWNDFIDIVILCYKITESTGSQQHSSTSSEQSPLVNPSGHSVQPADGSQSEPCSHKHFFIQSVPQRPSHPGQSSWLFVNSRTISVFERKKFPFPTYCNTTQHTDRESYDLNSVNIISQNLVLA